MKKLAVKAQLKLMGLKDKLKKKKGDVNIVSVLVIIAVFLLVTYPLYKTTLTTFMNSVATWFTTQTKNIFA